MRRENSFYCKHVNGLMNRLREGITLVELLRYINNSMVVDKVHHNKGKVLAVEKVVDMVGNMV